MTAPSLPKPSPQKTARQTLKALGKALASMDKRLYQTARTYFCLCDHLDFVHGDQNKGACEGVVSEFDGYAEFGPCPCGKFEAVA